MVLNIVVWEDVYGVLSIGNELSGTSPKSWGNMAPLFCGSNSMRLEFASVPCGCKGVRCPPIFSLSNLINVGWLVRKCVDI